MDVVLGQRQLFCMGEKGLRKRLVQYYQQTKNTATVMEFAVAILIRQALCVSDFSDTCKTVLREILLMSQPNDTLRRYCVLFQDYFTDEEWQGVILRLFSNAAEFRKLTKETCLYKTLLDKKNQETSKVSDYQFNIVSIFKDANGKRHTWTLKDAKKVCSEIETSEVLKILTSLTIFQVSGVRRFTEYVKFKSPKTCIDAEHEEMSVEQTETTQDTLNQKTAGSKNEALIQSMADQSAKSSQSPLSADEAVRALTHEELMAEIDAKYPLPGELSQNAAALVKETASPAKKTAGNSELSGKIKPKDMLQKPDTTYERYGKSMERIMNERKDKQLQREVNKLLGKPKNRRKR